MPFAKTIPNIKPKSIMHVNETIFKQQTHDKYIYPTVNTTIPQIKLKSFILLVFISRKCFSSRLIVGHEVNEGLENIMFLNVCV